MYTCKNGAKLVLNKISYLGPVLHDEDGEYRKVYFGDASATVRGEDVTGIENALEQSLGGAIWQWK